MSTTITFRRGTTAQIDAITPTSGEPVWETDGLKLAIGDGSTAGGLHLLMGDASDYVTKALFGAHSIIMAVSDDTPIKLDIAASRIVGRKASGNIAAMTGVETIALLTGANLDVGAYDVRGQTITADALTSGRVVFAGGSGVLSDSTNMTFATDTLTVAKLGAFEATGAINFGNQAMTNVDINSGAIDGTNVTVGSGKTLNMSSGTLTLDANQISGDKVEGGTINAITINTLTLGTAITGADKPYSDFGDMTAHAGSIIKSGSTNANTLLLAANDTTFITLTTGETDTMQFGAFTLAGAIAGGSQNVTGLGTLGCADLTTTGTTTIDTGLSGVIRADSGILSVDADVTDIVSDMVGDSGAGGTAGLAPAPGAGDTADGKFLKADGVWTAPAGGGDVTGPGSSTDNAIARFHETSGKVIQDYSSNAPTISDSGDMNIDGDLDVENIVVSGNVDGVDVSAHNDNTTTAHGAVSAATASKHVVRDASARAKFAAPDAAGDVLIKGTRVAVDELPAMTDEKIWKGSGTNVEEVDVYTDAAAVSAVEAAGLVLADTKVIQHDPTPGASHTANGEVVSMTCAAVVTGDELVFGDACYIDTSGTMQRALADDAAVTIPATHLCIATIAENAAGLFLTRGWAHDDSWTFDVGLSVYLSKDTPGLITKTMPTKVTGNQVQVLGTCLVADTIYWNPSLIVVEYA